MSAPYPPTRDYLQRQSEPYPARSTPVPNAILDRLSDLRNAEMRLLLVICRQTLGWRDPATGLRKRADWLTQSQLTARSGYSAAPLSRAIDALVQANLIRVTNDAGMPLTTPSERRRCRGRLWYSLAPALTQSTDGHKLPQLAHQEARDAEQVSLEMKHAKLNTTKQRMNKNEGNPNASVIGYGQSPKRQWFDHARQELATQNHSAATQQTAHSMVEREMELTVQEKHAAGGQWHWESAAKRWRRAVAPQAAI